jgi:predicted HTH domain antitoxin
MKVGVLVGSIESIGRKIVKIVADTSSLISLGGILEETVVSRKISLNIPRYYENVKMSWVVEGLKKLNEIEPESIEEILGGIKEENPQIFKSLVIGAYVDEKISLSKAAELLEVTRIELQKEFREKGVPIRLISQEDVIAEVEAIK